MRAKSCSDVLIGPSAVVSNPDAMFGYRLVESPALRMILLGSPAVGKQVRHPACLRGEDSEILSKTLRKTSYCQSGVRSAVSNFSSVTRCRLTHGPVSEQRGGKEYDEALHGG